MASTGPPMVMHSTAASLAHHQSALAELKSLLISGPHELLPIEPIVLIVWEYAFPDRLDLLLKRLDGTNRPLQLDGAFFLRSCAGGGVRCSAEQSVSWVD